MKTLLTAAVACFALGSCATTFYQDGRRVARFEGDSARQHFHMTPAGEIDWDGDVSHSRATTAAGNAAAKNLAAAAALPLLSP